MEDKYLSVTALTRYIKYKLDNDKNLQEVYLRGEISNFKAHTRGHYYFTIKDENSRINAIMFSFNASKLKFMPEDGMKVLVKGKISVFESTGNYQIYISDMLEDGVGNLHIAFEQLKKKLGDEGLFDLKYKKEIPKIPMKVGIITAPTGAAVKDILSTIKRRFPICKTILFPCLVQGGLAKDDIVKKLDIADNYGLDVIILGRGGGSIEDLWPFNEEIVARAIYDSKLPVISAVGHEVDITISDYVADLRAPTPTAAAELAVPDINTIITYLDTARSRGYTALTNIVNINYKKLDAIKNSYILSKPMSMYEIKEQKLDILIDSLNKAMNKKLENTKVKLYTLENSYILNNPNMLYKYSTQKLEHIISKLEVLNPLNTLSRGYAIIKKDGKVLPSVKNMKKDDVVTITLNDGEVTSKIIKVGEKNG